MQLHGNIIIITYEYKINYIMQLYLCVIILCELGIDNNTIYIEYLK